jgi:hypothetical protein
MAEMEPGRIGAEIVTILTGVIGVAILAVLVGGKNTSGVITSSAKGFGYILGVAEAPAGGNFSTPQAPN